MVQKVLERVEETRSARIWEHARAHASFQEWDGETGHITDEQLLVKFKEFMQMCGLPQLTVHSWRYIYATKLYLKAISPDAIKDILGVDKRTLKYYVKATQERKKKALFTYLVKVSVLPKE